MYITELAFHPGLVCSEEASEKQEQTPSGDRGFPPFTDARNTMAVSIRDFLKHRKDRAVGTILGHLEASLWSRLGPDERDQLRAVVLGAIGSYHDAVLDLMKADDTTRNDEIVTLLQRIDRHTAGWQPATLSVETSSVDSPQTDGHPAGVTG